MPEGGFYGRNASWRSRRLGSPGGRQFTPAPASWRRREEAEQTPSVEKVPFNLPIELLASLREKYPDQALDEVFIEKVQEELPKLKERVAEERETTRAAIIAWVTASYESGSFERVTLELPQRLINDLLGVASSLDLYQGLKALPFNQTPNGGLTVSMPAAVSSYILNQQVNSP